MTIKEATKNMLWNIERRNQRTAAEKGKRAYNKDVADALGITRATYSRLRTGVTMPKITTWQKIIILHKTIVGEKYTETIINQIECA